MPHLSIHSTINSIVVTFVIIALYAPVTIAVLPVRSAVNVSGIETFAIANYAFTLD